MKKKWEDDRWRCFADFGCFLVAFTMKPDFFASLFNIIHFFILILYVWYDIYIYLVLFGVASSVFISNFERLNKKLNITFERATEKK